MTLRELVLKAVQGLKNDFYTENDRVRLVEYILSNSHLSVHKDRLDLNSYNIFGVGEDNKDRELPYNTDFILFYWGNAIKGEDLLGFNRRWTLETFLTFEGLERAILNFRREGEYVVLVEDKVESYKLEQNFKPFCEFEIFWENLKPYKVSYEVDSSLKEELFNSKLELCRKVLELYNENNNNNIRIENIFDNEQYGYTITGRTYTVDVKGNEEVRESSIVLHTDYLMY